jgi:succinoglycan biosynthesis transport protein ExoP
MRHKHGLIRQYQAVHGRGPIDIGPIVTAAPISSGAGFNRERAFRILRRNWGISVAFAMSVLIGVTILAFTMQPIYEPKARIEIDPPGAAIFSLVPNPSPGENALDYLETQTEILKSDELAVAVIQALHLDQNPEFLGQGKLHRVLAAVARVLHRKQTKPGDNQQTARRLFSDRLSVYQVRNSRLVEVSFASSDPKLAAEVTNTLVNHFIDRNYRTRYGTTMQASEWLSSQLDDLRKKIEKSNRALAHFQNANGIVEIDEKQNTVTQKVGELNRQLTQAQADRIQLEACVRVAEAGGADSLPQIRDNPLIQTLTQRSVESRANLAQALAIYGKNNSKAKKLQNEADEMEAQLTAERLKVVRQLNTSYESARTREALMEQALEKMTGVTSTMNEKVAQYNFLKKEAQGDEDLYNTLVARLREASIAAGVKSSSILIVDRAPVLENPTRPRRLQIIALGLILGVLGGIALPFLKESLEQTIRTSADIGNWTGLAAMGMIPMISASTLSRRQDSLPLWTTKLLGNGSKAEQDGSAQIFFLERPHSAESEAVRSLCSYIKLSRPDKPPRIVLVSSPSPGEGKTTVAVNLAMALARHGTTCLVDADMRRPMVARAFGLTCQQGLSDVLEGSAALQTVMQTVPNLNNLTIVPGGRVPANPGELVASGSMRELVRVVSGSFENVVIDSPPIIPLADARVLSQLADGVVVVGLCGLTTREAITLGTKILDEVRAPILGVVLNGVERNSPYYHYRYD